jgi:predicted DNA-binding transcriptional regulator YafY
VEVEFKGYAANYVSERIWTPDQKIIKKGKGKVRLILNASSEPELTTWLLSFGDEARLLKPEYLQKKIRDIANRIQDYCT